MTTIIENQTTFTDKEEEISTSELKSKLSSFSIFLHPIRMSIVWDLYVNGKQISSDLRTNLDVSWGKYTTHLGVLEEAGLIDYCSEFVDNKITRVVYLNQNGLNNFLEYRSFLLSISENTYY